MKHGWFASVVALFAVVLLVDSSTRSGDKEEKKEITIKMVMKKAHAKGGLLEKVNKGDASKEEKQQLVTLYEALASATPPRGDETSWKEKTEALVKAVKADDTAALKKAADCSACHKEHKGKKK